MAIIQGAEMWFAKLDPKRPNATFNEKNPQWEVQIRTTDQAVVAKWRELKLDVKVLTTKDKDDPDLKVPVLDEKGNKIYRVNLKKGSLKADGSAAEPVDCVNGALKQIDPNTIGNGSIANIRVYQYEKLDKKTGKPITLSMLMGVQITRHIVYEPKIREGFDMTETEVVHQQNDDAGADDTQDTADAPAELAGNNAAPAAGTQAPADKKAEDLF